MWESKWPLARESLTGSSDIEEIKKVCPSIANVRTFFVGSQSPLMDSDDWASDGDFYDAMLEFQREDLRIRVRQARFRQQMFVEEKQSNYFQTLIQAFSEAQDSESGDDEASRKKLDESRNSLQNLLDEVEKRRFEFRGTPLLTNAGGSGDGKVLHGLGLTQEKAKVSQGESSPQGLEILNNRDRIIAATIYANDLLASWKEFDEIAPRIQLFTDLVNEKLDRKSIRVVRELGFEFNVVKRDGSLGGLHHRLLSNGEKRLVSMFYDLVFNCDSKNLVLIDEPESGMHFDWKRSFSGDLRRISRTSDLNFLVATHSPTIVGDEEAALAKSLVLHYDS